MNGISITLDRKITIDYGVSLTGNRIKIWDGEGLPVFSGTLEDANRLYPSLIKNLILTKAIKAK